MLNVSICSLMCSLMNIKSHLIQQSFKATKFSLLSSTFSKLTSTVFSSYIPGSYDISRCSFSHILNSAVKITDMYLSGETSISQRNITEPINVCIDHYGVNITQCLFMNCFSNNTGGGLCTTFCVLNMNDTYFIKNNAKYGGGSHCSSLYKVSCNRNVYYSNSAEYDGGCVFATFEEEKFTYFSDFNLTFNTATMWTGGFRIDQCGGIFQNSFIAHNNALVCGGFFDFSWYPNHRNVTRTIFLNNTAVARSGAATAFHIYQFLNFYLCIFINNYCEKSANSISIESIRTTVEIQNCMFSGSKEEELTIRYEGSQFIEKGVNFYSCTNDQFNERYFELQQIQKPKKY